MKFKREHGSISVFFSIIMAVIIAFMGMLVDLARIRVSEAQVRRSAQLALDSVMSQYSRTLREDYGLFGYAMGDEAVNAAFVEYFEANLSPAKGAQKSEYDKLIATIGDWLLDPDNPSYGDMLGLTAKAQETFAEGLAALSDTGVLYQQMMEFSKYRAPLNMAMNNDLDELTNMMDNIKQINEESKIVNKMSELAEPEEKYIKQQNELSDLAEELYGLICITNDDIDAWNTLMNGEAGDIQVQEGVPVNKYLEPRTSFNGCNFCGNTFEMLIGVDMRSGSYDVRVSGRPYNLGKMLDGIQDFMDEIDGIAEDCVSRYRNRYENMEFLLEQLWNNVDLCNENADISYENYLACLEAEANEQAQIEWSNYQDYNAQASDYAGHANDIVSRINSLTTPDSYKNQIYNELMNGDALDSWLDGFHTAQLDETETRYRKLLDDFNEIGEKKKEFRAAIAALRGQATTVKDTAENIGQTVEQATGDGTCGFEIKQNWEDTRISTNERLDNDETVLQELEDCMELLDKWVDNNSALTVFDPEGISLDFLNVVTKAHNSGNRSMTWDNSDYIVRKIDHNAKPEYEPYPEDEYQENKAKENKKELQDKQDEANEKKDKYTPKDIEKRYNPDPVPEAYKEALSGKRAKDDEEPSNKKLSYDDVDKSSTAKQASDNSNQSSGLVDRICDEIMGNLSYTLGAVYGSEYVLNMFGNAAPEQEKNELPASMDDFEYATVVTLRNEEPMGILKLTDTVGGESDGNAPDPRLGYFYNGEVEYILYGKDKEKDNVKSTQVMLDVVLFAVNYLQVMSCKTLSTPVNAAAAALAALGVPTIVTKVLLFTVLAVAETALDVHYLMMGYKIPAFSRSSDALFLLNDPNAVLGAYGDKDFRLSYEFYLRLRLMLAFITDGDGVLGRMGNLIQINVRYGADVPDATSYPHDGEFLISEAYTSFAAESAAEMPYWFMTQAVMGKNQLDGKHQISGGRIVTSY